MKNDITPNRALADLNTYFKWRVLRAKKLIQLAEVDLQLKNKVVLEVGCGLGPVAHLLSRSYNQVYAVDPSRQALSLLKKFSPNKTIKAVKAKNEKLPFKNNFFDVIFSFDSFEHVKNPTASMKEMARVLKNSGRIILEITPYYSLVAGHHLYNFSLLPAQYLPRKFVKWWLWQKKPQGIRTAREAWKTFINLNKVRIDVIRQLVKDNQLNIRTENFIFKIPSLLEIKINWVKYFGWLKDLLPMSYQLVLEKDLLVLPKKNDYPHALNILNHPGTNKAYQQLVEASASAYFETCGPTRWLFIKRFLVAQSYLKKIGHVDSLLDAGTGIGFFLPLLSCYGRTVTAVDYAEHTLKYARDMGHRRKIKNVKFLQADLLRFKSRQKFDLINALSVLEHIPPDKLPMLMKKFQSLLKPGGYLIAGWPNEGNHLFKLAQTWEKRLLRPKMLQSLKDERRQYKPLGHVSQNQQILSAVNSVFSEVEFRALPFDWLKFYSIGLWQLR